MNIGVIVETRYLSQAMPKTVITVLKDQGYSVDILNPIGGFFLIERGEFTDAYNRTFILHDYDLVLSRNRNPFGLVMLKYIEDCEIPSINTHSAIQKVCNKAKMAINLSVAGIPTVPTLLANDVEALYSNINTSYPILLKATYGDNCQGLLLVRNQDELSEVEWDNDLVLAQNYFRNDGYDIKLYVCGEHIIPVRKPSPFNGDPGAPIMPVELTREYKELASKCGELFGLDLFGVDCIETETGTLVIEVNDFPNYSGIPQIEELVANFIITRAEKA